MISRYALSPMKELWTDEAKYERWLRVELAVAQAQSALGQLPPAAYERIRATAAQLDVAQLVQRSLEIENQIGHDLLAFLRALEEAVGPEGRYLHRGLTSYDVEDTALSMAMRDGWNILIDELQQLCQVVKGRAVEHKRTLMAGRTHGMHAEPTSFGLKLLVWYAELQRHSERWVASSKTVSVGKISGPVGTYAQLDPEVEARVCQQLKLHPAAVSNQSLQRDRHAQVVTTLAIAGGTLEKMATEIRNLHRTEIAEVKEAAAHGSSSMPHKQNPSTCETICGLARLLRAHATAALENIAVWHEQDLSRSSVERIIIPDSFMTMHYMLRQMTEVLKHLVVDVRRMRANLEASLGTVFSHALLLRLIDGGMSRAQAHELIAQLSSRAQTTPRHLREVAEQDPSIQQHLRPNDLNEVFAGFDRYLLHVDSIFSRFA